MSTNVKFKFDMLKYDYASVEIQKEDNIETSRYTELNLKLQSFEKYILKKYILNYMKYAYEVNKNSGILLTNFIYNVIFQYVPFLNIKVKKEIINKYEDQISKLKNIQTVLKNNYKKDGIYKITKEVIAAQPESREILNNLFKELFKNISIQFKKIKTNTLTKSFYTNNFEYLIKKINIKNKNIIELARLSLYINLKTFNIILPVNLDRRQYFWKNAPQLLGYDIKYSDVLKYRSSLFYIDLDGGSVNYFAFNNSFCELCFTEVKNQEDCLNTILNPLDKEDLTKEDFMHISQYEYIKDILIDALKNHTKGINILFYGKPGTGKSALAKVLMQEISKFNYQVPTNDTNKSNMIAYDSQKGINDMRKSSYTSMQMLLKNNKNSLILYDEAEDFFRKNEMADQSKGIINDILENNYVPTLWTTNSIACIEKSFLRRFTYTLNIDNLSNNSYQTIINKLKNKHGIDLTDELNDMLIQYKPNIGITEKVLKNYKISNKDPKNFKQDLLDSLKCLNNGYSISKLPVNQFKFNINLVNSQIDLNDLTARIKDSGKLDFSLLLYGFPGTSKTSFGRYLAEELNLKVINKNYTELSSCWVGETEKNIAEMFEQAEQEKALIILDECDVLLQNRNRANRSWEISQTEALLTAMEFHPYPFIMTTNLYENLDPAVMRRILYKVKFDYLNSNQVNLAFKHFFNLDISEDLHLSKLTSGDFAVIKKQATFENRLQDKDWLINRLIDEMNRKKELITNEIKL